MTQSTLFQQRLEFLASASLGELLRQGRKGLEKECLRVNPEGRIAQTPHPEGLGSALTHPYITTDYSEALLEYRTPPCSDIHETRQFLTELHQFTYQVLDNELLWAASMPCVLGGDAGIPIARYGSSNVGKMKHVYRIGLGYRYGRAMQAIAGIHYNYSLPETFWPLYQEYNQDLRSAQQFISATYFGLVRNFIRIGWIIPYLFGASPAVCKSFLNLRTRNFPEFDKGTYFKPYATSLRMSDIGYKNENQADLKISYNSLTDYVHGLTHAIKTPYSPYEKIGVKVDGEYRQLNANILQIENEYYSFVRPKQIAQSGERPTLALQRRGVQYVEIRALDVNLYDPVGVDETTLRFLELLLLWCLLQESPPLSAEEREGIDRNHSLVAANGREPGLKLHQLDRERPLQEWALALCEQMEPLCKLLDTGLQAQPYTTALNVQKQNIREPERLPSTRILAEMREREEDFFSFARRWSRQHEQNFKIKPLDAVRQQHYVEAAAQSLVKQREIEAKDTLSFDEYLTRYFEQS